MIRNCPASFVQYSDQGSNKALVTWPLPVAVDNVDVVVDVSRTAGPAPATYFTEQPIPYTIQYDATDSAGNKALPCIFTVTVLCK